MKRMMTRARGSGSSIRKRSSHIRIVLTDEIEIKRREKKPATKKKPAAKKVPRTTTAKTAPKETPAAEAAPAPEVSAQNSES
jgi:hypothetical protein